MLISDCFGLRPEMESDAYALLSRPRSPKKVGSRSPERVPRKYKAVGPFCTPGARSPTRLILHCTERYLIS